MVGLDAAGKTTILYKLKLGEGESGVDGCEWCWTASYAHFIISCCYLLQLSPRFPQLVSAVRLLMGYSKQRLMSRFVPLLFERIQCGDC
jgi:hypothetical protein